MSDLWDRCRLDLRQRMSLDDWRRSIEHLRAWIVAGELHLWVHRDADDWRAIPNPARDLDRDIRETVRLVWGRAPRRVHYLERPPDRESITNQRRIPDHRERLRREEGRRNEVFLEDKREEWRWLAANPPDLRTCRSLEEVLVRLDAIAWDRARRRQDRRGVASGRGEAPFDPPPWPFPASFQHG